MSEIVQRPLEYAGRLEAREPDVIRRAIIHATELPDMATAREYGERIHYPGSGTGNSGHFYIDRDGRIEQWVPLERVAHHVKNHNRDSIGIELVNRGRWPDWLDSGNQHWEAPYAEAQIEALIALLNSLQSSLPALGGIAGHDRLDPRTVPASDDYSVEVRRRLDPGPLFPWDRVLEATGLVVMLENTAIEPEPEDE